MLKCKARKQRRSVWRINLACVGFARFVRIKSSEECCFPLIKPKLRAIPPHRFKAEQVRISHLRQYQNTKVPLRPRKKHRQWRLRRVIDLSQGGLIDMKAPLTDSRARRNAILAPETCIQAPRTSNLSPRTSLLAQRICMLAPETATSVPKIESQKQKPSC